MPSIGGRNIAAAGMRERPFLMRSAYQKVPKNSRKKLFQLKILELPLNTINQIRDPSLGLFEDDILLLKGPPLLEKLIRNIQSSQDGNLGKGVDVGCSGDFLHLAIQVASQLLHISLRGLTFEGVSLTIYLNLYGLMGIAQLGLLV